MQGWYLKNVCWRTILESLNVKAVQENLFVQRRSLGLIHNCCQPGHGIVYPCNEICTRWKRFWNDDLILQRWSTPPGVPTNTQPAVGLSPCDYHEHDLEKYEERGEGVCSQGTARGAGPSGEPCEQLGWSSCVAFLHIVCTPSRGVEKGLEGYLSAFGSKLLLMKGTSLAIEGQSGLCLKWLKKVGRRKAEVRGGARMRDGQRKYVGGFSRHLPWETAWDSGGKPRWCWLRCDWY